jgi:hypothetical protein
MQRRAIERHARTVGVVVSVLFARAHEGFGVVARPGLLVGTHVCRLQLPECSETFHSRDLISRSF